MVSKNTRKFSGHAKRQNGTFDAISCGRRKSAMNAYDLCWSESGVDGASVSDDSIENVSSAVSMRSDRSASRVKEIVEKSHLRFIKR